MRINSFAKSRVPRLSRVFGFLREQEDKDESGEDESAGDDLFGGDDEGGDDEGGDDTGDDSEDDSTDDESDKKDDDEKKDDKIKISAEDKARLEDSIDDELEGLMVDYETDARKAAAITSEKSEEIMKKESLRRVYRHLLKEVSADDIDVKHFANNIARLVKNYDTLLDMNSIILNKAYSYIKNNYGDETVKALKDTLEQDFNIEVEREKIDKDIPEVPIAVGGAGGESGGSGL